MSLIALLVQLALVPTGRAYQVQTAPSDCEAVREWVDYLNTVIDRERDLAQREVELTRDPGVSTDALADGLATVATAREAINAEFQAHAVPPSALPVQTAFSLAWELNAEIASAYVRALRTGDERQRGVADGYTEASSTIEARAGRLLNALLNACNA
jgi:hypothetical protein